MMNRETERPTPLELQPVDACLHTRLIDDILTEEGKRTGKVRCFECGAIFEDPSTRLK